MIKEEFNIYEGSLQERFQSSRAKIQIFGGGFANGKTAGACIKALQLAQDYPGSNGLIARSTYPKLNDTIRKEFKKWCPSHWIKSWPKNDNTCELQNGTIVNFRYVQQTGKSTVSTSSNLLSATYDWIAVDQMDDPEFSYKDFLDLLGRLRGSTRYTGDDPTMPSSGPRWIVVTVNPTRNWFFKQLVQPIHNYAKTGNMSDDLTEMLDAYGAESPTDFIDLHEGSTYENKDNLEPDYIRGLEAMYRGQMRERYLLGEWGAYEGLVYPQFDETIHCVSQKAMHELLFNLTEEGFAIEILEGYDHGLAVPSCYLFGFVDHVGNIHILDGMYEKEHSITDTTQVMRRIRGMYIQGQFSGKIFADPDIFRRKAGDRRTVGVSTSSMFWDQSRGVKMTRGNSDIINGIAKMQSYLNVQERHINPYTGEEGAPYIYIAHELGWWASEIADYYWAQKDGDWIDKPRDGNDHAMDCTKYLLSKRPMLSKLIVVPPLPIKPGYMSWRETNLPRRRKGHRYGAQT